MRGKREREREEGAGEARGKRERERGEGRGERGEGRGERGRRNVYLQTKSYLHLFRDQGETVQYGFATGSRWGTCSR